MEKSDHMSDLCFIKNSEGKYDLVKNRYGGEKKGLSIRDYQLIVDIFSHLRISTQSF